MRDRFPLHAKGGDGGNGCSSFRRSRHDRRGRPDGMFIRSSFITGLSMIDVILKAKWIQYSWLFFFDHNLSSFSILGSIFFPFIVIVSVELHKCS